MSTICSAPAAARDTAGHTAAQSWVRGVAAMPKRWWVAYITRRIEHEAMTELWSMSDLELKDIGLTRGEIMGAVKGEGGTRSRVHLLANPRPASARS